MNPMETYFHVLAAVAAADEQLHPNEALLVRSAATEARLTTDELARVEDTLGGQKRWLLEGVAHLGALTESTLAEALRDGYVVALCDGVLDQSEIQCLDEVMSAAGIASEARPALHEWARRAAEHHVDGLALLSEWRAR